MDEPHFNIRSVSGLYKLSCPLNPVGTTLLFHRQTPAFGNFGFLLVHVIMFISRYSLLLSFAFIFFPLVKGRVPQNSNRRKFLEENYHGGRLEKLRQVFQKREKLHYQELCATDGMYSFVSENSTARSLCLEALGYPETTTATTTIHSTM